ncbi:MAG TPA: phosphatase PAP2 family protein [Anaerolineales bacterium]|nr:phosphatase PAP2 family protein [Anaerolineales bacterium]
MKDAFKKYFRAGIFGTGWGNALISIALAAAVYFTNGIYDLLNHGPAVWILRTPLDDALPVVRPFVIPYVSLNYVVYFTLIAFLLFRTRLFQSACLAMLTAWFVSYFFYFFFQTEVIRPALTGTDVLTRMIQNVYAGDHPFNDFPSLHTSISTILAIHWFRFDRRAGIIAAVWTALIVASTVLIKQHYVADVASGLLLAFGAAWLYQRLIIQRNV